MKCIELPIPGCFELLPKVFQDDRGLFVKTYHSEMFLESKLETNFVEQYYSISYKNVLRGLHFQSPPTDHNKLVYCPKGSVLDVIVDLRKGSPAYGTHHCIELNDHLRNSVYIPKGVAHGFYTLSDQALMIYNVSTVYSPEHDSGIHWQSLSIPWPGANPIVSDRDSNFPALKDFITPFSYSEVDL